MHSTATLLTNTHRTQLYALLCACIAACLLCAAPPTHAARKKTDQTTNATKPKTPSQKKGSTTTKHYRSPSEESTSERDRRLYRECRGRPNAGACLGYAHGRP